MIKELFYKLFGIEPFPCESCETLRAQLLEANREKRELLELVLSNSKKTEEVKIPVEEPKPIQPKSIPWRVRQQMLENEDRARARIVKESTASISTEELEKELDIAGTEREKVSNS